MKTKCGNFTPEIYPFIPIPVKVIKIEPAVRDVEVLVKNQNEDIKSKSGKKSATFFQQEENISESRQSMDTFNGEQEKTVSFTIKLNSFPKIVDSQEVSSQRSFTLKTGSQQAKEDAINLATDFQKDTENVE